MELVSRAFSDGGQIPTRYATPSAAGSNESIPYAWSGAPAGTRSFALSLVDEAPIARRWVHWIVVDLPPSVMGLDDGASSSSALPPAARELVNTHGSKGYSGPQPPPGSGMHPYVATLYALDVATVDAPEAPTAEQFERTVAAHAIGKATITGTFGR